MGVDFGLGIFLLFFFFLWCVSVRVWYWVEDSFFGLFSFYRV